MEWSRAAAFTLMGRAHSFHTKKGGKNKKALPKQDGGALREWGVGQKLVQTSKRGWGRCRSYGAL